jgi:hypothetical protein
MNRHVPKPARQWRHLSKVTKGARNGHKGGNSGDAQSIPEIGSGNKFFGWGNFWSGKGSFKMALAGGMG